MNKPRKIRTRSRLVLVDSKGNKQPASGWSRSPQHDIEIPQAKKPRKTP